MEPIATLLPYSIIAMAFLAATGLVAVFFAYIHSIKRQDYLLLWTVAWALLALHHTGPALATWIPSSALEGALSRTVYGWAAIFFFLGAQRYACRKLWVLPAAITAVVLLLWALANGSNLITLVPVVIPSAAIFVGVAVIFWRENRRQETLADRLLAISFVAWAALRVALFYFFSDASGEVIGSLRAVSAVPSACLLYTSRCV